MNILSTNAEIYIFVEINRSPGEDYTIATSDLFSFEIYVFSLHYIVP